MSLGRAGGLLRRLDALVDEWRVRIDADGHLMDGGRTVFTWPAGE